MDIEEGSSHSHQTLDGEIAAPSTSSPTPSPSAVEHTLLLLQSDDLNMRLQAAKEIRRLTKTSQRYRRRFSSAVGHLVDMLTCDSNDASEEALTALLNLAVKDETNKVNIIDAGALKPIIGFVKSENLAVQEHAVAALITLSASSINKPIISASGAIPLLVQILRSESSHATKVDAVMALYNLSTHPDALTRILNARPIPPLVNLLKCCTSSSRTAEKCTALIESLVGFKEGRLALKSEEGGILAVVEVLEGGSIQSREHAVGALLIMCESNRTKYREPILREGVIPGLLQLTVYGTPKSIPKAHTLLRLLRDAPYPLLSPDNNSDLEPDTLEIFVCKMASQIEMGGEDQREKARQMLAEMVQVSMKQSLRQLQKRALVCPIPDFHIPNC